MREFIEGLSLREAAFRAAVAFKSLLEDLNLPTSLQEVDVREDMIPQIAKSVSKSPKPVARNLRKVREEGMGKLFKQTYEGKLKYEE